MKGLELILIKPMVKVNLLVPEKREVGKKE
jgi:hypothetical protein